MEKRQQNTSDSGGYTQARPNGSSRKLMFRLQFQQPHLQQPAHRERDPEGSTECASPKIPPGCSGRQQMPSMSMEGEKHRTEKSQQKGREIQWLDLQSGKGVLGLVPPSSGLFFVHYMKQCKE